MRFGVLVCLAAAASAGCAGKSSEVEMAARDASERAKIEGHWPPSAAVPAAAPAPAPATRRSTLDHDIAKADRDMRELALKPLRAFLANKKAPCSHDDVRKAKGYAAGLMTTIEPKRHGLEATLSAGDVGLEVADGLKSRGCRDDARALYDQVLKIYSGSAYAALRDRAKVGIDDLRSIR